MTITRDQLRPCPFCGGLPDIYSFAGTGWHFVECCDCGAASRRMDPDDLDYPEELVQSWNRRTPADQPQGGTTDDT